jgi:hypothetical protein
VEEKRRTVQVHGKTLVPSFGPLMSIHQRKSGSEAKDPPGPIVLVMTSRVINPSIMRDGNIVMGLRAYSFTPPLSH